MKQITLGGLRIMTQQTQLEDWKTGRWIIMVKTRRWQVPNEYYSYKTKTFNTSTTSWMEQFFKGQNVFSRSNHNGARLRDKKNGATHIKLLNCFAALLLCKRIVYEHLQYSFIFSPTRLLVDMRRICVLGMSVLLAI